MKLQKHTNLSEHTSIKLGGVAKHFTQCDSVEELQEALEYAKENKLEVYILAGGSNTIFPDKGFDGLVVKIDLKGVSYKGDLVTAAAGVGWDDLVQECIKKDLAGINITKQLKQISFTPNIPIIELKKESIYSENIDKLPELRKQISDPSLITKPLPIVKSGIFLWTKGSFFLAIRI